MTDPVFKILEDIQFNLSQVSVTVSKLASRPPCVEGEYWEVREAGRWVASFQRQDDAIAFGRGPSREVFHRAPPDNRQCQPQGTGNHRDSMEGSRVDLSALALRVRTPVPRV